MDGAGSMNAPIIRFSTTRIRAAIAAESQDEKLRNQKGNAFGLWASNVNQQNPNVGSQVKGAWDTLLALSAHRLASGRAR